MQPDVTKDWTVGKIRVRILDQADGESKAWFIPAGPTSNSYNHQFIEGGDTTAEELRQMANALNAAAEHIEPSPNRGGYGINPEAEARKFLDKARAAVDEHIARCEESVAEEEEHVLPLCLAEGLQPAIISASPNIVVNIYGVNNPADVGDAVKWVMNTKSGSAA